MADDKDESTQTEEPTAKRQQEARARGQVPLSREVNSWLVLLAATLGLVNFADDMMRSGRQIVRYFLEKPHMIAVEADTLPGFILDVLLSAAVVVGPVILAIVVASVASTIVQVGWLFSPESIKPSFEKLSPLKGLNRLFSVASLVEFAKGLLKLAIVGTACYLVTAPGFDSLPLFVLREPEAAMAILGGLSQKLLVATVAVLTLIAAADVAYQRIRLNKELRMSRSEIRDEVKDQEGDPMVKAKLRQIRHERSRRRMMQAVPKADVVITNPTHYAVALKYERDTMDAPVLVAKGVDAVALRIRELATENDVPIVENPPLARALHATVEIDEEIEPEHYKAVAEIISYVLKLRGDGRAAAGDAPKS
ncbi:MAG: flagellar biosynthesis protein FlhB [Alphaproteobacteria bacterium]|nr:flagellar biosynthesis protein FlhB [Alphaproteobacteria bacterium]